jgi:hypothetical protein
LADVKKAIDFMLHQEDSQLKGTITNYASDRGGLTRFGLCAKFHPKLVAAGFYSPDMPVEQALPIAEQTYAEEYARPMRLAELSSDAVACGMISFAVLDGLGSAVRLLRLALYTLGYTIPVSSPVLDQALFTAELHSDEKKLVPALVAQQRIRCLRIAADPSQKVNLQGWNNRSDQVLALVQ